MPGPKEQIPPLPLQNSAKPTGLRRWIKKFKNQSLDKSAAETPIAITEDNPATDFITVHERALLSNILKLRELKVVNVMIPRANIVAVEMGTPASELISLLAERQYSRIPVYRETLDDVIGTIHLKDVVAALARGDEPDIKKMVTDIPIVSPAMTILNLLLKMRQSSRHMALVVDEYGGIDGLVTIGDVLEAIVGEIEDEHTEDETPQIIQRDDGSHLVDARLDISEFEERFGPILSEEERESSDTLSGLVFLLAGHIPARGEIINHSSGMIFEVLDADPRRINLLRVQNPVPPAAAQAEQPL